MWIIALLAAGVSSAGCGLFRKPTPAPPAIVIVPPPILLPELQNPAPMPPPQELSPRAAMTPMDFSFDLVLGPPPRRVAAERAGESDERSHPPDAPAAPPAESPAPQMGIALTPAQAARARQQAQIRIGEVQRELTLLNARSYSGEAAATRSQVGEYLAQAQQAWQTGDWLRSQNLADKADTLARYLLGR